MDKKIAIVNLDMIMCNVIRVYLPLIDIHGYPGACWDRIHKQLKLRPIVDLRYDFNILLYLNRFLMNSVKKGAKLTCVDNITDYEKLFDLEDGVVYKITNLGFFSGLHEDEDLATLDKYNVINWTSYLKNHNKMAESYEWVKCINSDVSDYLAIAPKGKTYKTIATFKPDYKYDEVIFVFSPLFVPEEYRHLYDLIVEDINILLDKE